MGAVGVVPAAGAAERFGGGKMLANVGGEPLLERTIASLLEGGVERVVVVVGPSSDDLRHGVPLLGDPRVRTAVNDHPEDGMISSLKVGVRLAQGDPIVVLPGDMPYVEPATVAVLLAEQAGSKGIVSPRFEGKRGHPVVLPARLRVEIEAAAEGETLHDVLRRHASERRDLDVADKGVIRDVDSPTDLEPAP
jgi:molybdenum cofactor cytidylyltransferase